MKEFIKSLFSIEEHRASVTIIAFMCVLTMGLWKTFRFGDYPANLLELTVFLGGYVFGFNVANKFSKSTAIIPQAQPVEVKSPIDRTMVSPSNTDESIETHEGGGK